MKQRDKERAYAPVGAGSRYWVPARLPDEPMARIQRTAKQAGDVEIFTYARRGIAA